MKALVVEDEPVMRSLLQARLQARGHEVIAVADAEAAWEVLQRTPIPLVLLDWLLPGRDGLDLCRQLRGLSHGHVSFVVVITARSEPDDLAVVLDAGADDYLTKPVQQDLFAVRLAIAERGARNRVAQYTAELARNEAEQRLRAVLSNAPIATLVTELDGAVRSARGRLLPQLGVRVPGLVGQGAPTLVEAGLVTADALAHADAGETIVVTRPVGERLFEIRVCPLAAEYDVNDAQRALSVVVYDVTPHLAAARRAERQAIYAERQREQYREALAHAGVGVVLLDSTGHIRELSTTSARLLSVEPSWAAGRPWEDALGLSEAHIAQLREHIDAVGLPDHSGVPVVCSVTHGANRVTQVRLDVSQANDSTVMLLARDVSDLYELRRLLEDESHIEVLIGRSIGMQRLRRQARDLAVSDWPVLVEGEPGTGGADLARAIHADSPRADGPFVVLRCSELSDEALRTALFGSALDDGNNAMPAVEAASGGTLLLEDVGRLSRQLQAQLLRLLQEGTWLRTGDPNPRVNQARVLTSTAEDLSLRVASGRFQGDLLHALRGATVRLIPLRERREDIPLLVDAMLARGRAEHGRSVLRVHADAIRMLSSYAWPGNIEELSAAVTFALQQGDSTTLEPDELPHHVRIVDGATFDLDEKARILEAISRAGGNRKLAATVMGVSRATFYRRLERYGIPTKDEQR